MIVRQKQDKAEASRQRSVRAGTRAARTADNEVLRIGSQSRRFCLVSLLGVAACAVTHVAGFLIICIGLFDIALNPFSRIEALCEFVTSLGVPVLLAHSFQLGRIGRFTRKPRLSGDSENDNDECIPRHLLMVAH